MAFNPGKNVGNVSIRVVPDTTKFRNELRRKLEVIERTTRMTVRVDKAKVDNHSIRESIRKQLAEIKGIEAESVVQVTVDSARIRRKKLRQSIQEQFDKMQDVRVWIAPALREKDEEQFQRDVKRMVNKASRNTVTVDTAARTLAAAAQFRYLTRPRFVDIFVRVNKASALAAAQTLAALSGARLSWKWIDDLLQKFKELDRNLPKIIGWTSALTALGAGIMASVSGLVGIGQGLFSILPAFLTVPGLIINAAGSVTVLIVALKHASEELSVLKADMNELGDIIRTTFWDHAREPIVNLVQGLMPQLRNSFRELSTGVGVFTAALADAFGDELGGGRLEGIFAGIAEGWRILATGASGFAGAIVSLSEIAAKYTPRLAAWFVRQANTFDSWLTSIATDGRLDAWMEGAIDSMYDLWDATKGVAGVFSGIWRAANAAGSGGLKGFAQMMQDWKRIVNSADFQRGLEAVFRGSYAAMDAFGGAIQSLGRLIGDMPSQFERFVGSAGGFIGGVLDSVFQALNNTNVRIGLDEFSRGLDNALAGIKPALQPIADTFGKFLGLLGDLAENLLPTATEALAEVMPAVETVMGSISEVLPDMTSAVTSITDTLGPALDSFAKAVTPSLENAFSALADGIETIAPSIATLVTSVGPILADAIDRLIPAIEPIAKVLSFVIEALGGLFQVGSFLDGLDISKGGNPLNLFNPEWVKKQMEGIAGSGTWFEGLIENVAGPLEVAGKEGARKYADGLRQGLDPYAAGVASTWTKKIHDEFSRSDEHGQAMWEAFVDAKPDASVIAAVKANLDLLGIEIKNEATKQGEGAAQNLNSGLARFSSYFPSTASAIKSTIGMNIPSGMLYGIGEQVTQGMANGMKSSRALGAIIAAANVVAGNAVGATKIRLGIASPSKVMAREVGRWIPAGIARGIDQTAYMVKRSAEAAVDLDLFKNRPAPAGQGGASKVVNLHWHNPVARDPMQEAMEARDLAEAVM